MSRIFKTIFFATTIGFVACSSRAGNTRPLDELNASTSSATSNLEYKVRGGDTLMVKVWGEPQVSGEVYVREDGRFSLPLINDVEAEGKTLRTIASEVTKKLKAFIPTTSVSISVLQTAAVRYYLSGAFVKPAEYRSERKITLLQAIATGGGFAPFANESSIVFIRKTEEGELRYELDYNRIISGKEPNPELKDGDIIAVE